MTHPLSTILDANNARIRRHVLAGLERNGWRLHATARDLDVRPTTLQRLIDHHDLRTPYAAHSPGRGRPSRSPTPHLAGQRA